ncbi:Guanylate kinase 1 [Porphyridium purpureum]|uniref:guanylate kinase n=1 Tax=Porphyridium purpureum TaxID=35688 RepID=A0A5J4YL07_PORPP|nr:Guanylate kinase 1 [Porphyridium purpureum]|eukprot:POR2959..scf210_14
MGANAGALPRALVVAGPSGVGKGTLIARLKERHGAHMGFSVSHTTRAPRQGEKHGVHYNFATVDDMKAQIAQHHFIEWAEVHGRYYGTSVRAVESVREQNKLCILDIDVQGCRSVRRAQLPAVIVFVSPPSMEELERRLRSRGTESEEQMQTRLATAAAEMDARNEPGLFDIEIVNNDLDSAYLQLEEIFVNELKRAGIAEND